MSPLRERCSWPKALARRGRRHSSTVRCRSETKLPVRADRNISFWHTGKEALYIHQVVVTKASKLALNGLKVYCDGQEELQSPTLNGTIVLGP